MNSNEEIDISNNSYTQYVCHYIRILSIANMHHNCFFVKEYIRETIEKLIYCIYKSLLNRVQVKITIFSILFQGTHIEYFMHNFMQESMNCSLQFFLSLITKLSKKCK